MGGLLYRPPLFDVCAQDQAAAAVDAHDNLVFVCLADEDAGGDAVGDVSSDVCSLWRKSRQTLWTASVWPTACRHLGHGVRTDWLQLAKEIRYSVCLCGWSSGGSVMPQ